MAEEIAFENCRISNYEGLMTLTLDQVILHTIKHREIRHVGRGCPPTCNISRKSKKLFVDRRTYVHTYAQTGGHLRPALLSRLCQRVDQIQQITDRLLQGQHKFLDFLYPFIWPSQNGTKDHVTDFN